MTGRPRGPAHGAEMIAVRVDGAALDAEGGQLRATGPHPGNPPPVGIARVLRDGLDAPDALAFAVRLPCGGGLGRGQLVALAVGAAQANEDAEEEETAEDDEHAVGEPFVAGASVLAAVFLLLEEAGCKCGGGGRRHDEKT